MESSMKILDQVVGFVDIGTNAVRLLVVRINPNHSYTMITREKEVVRLGEQEFIDHELKPDAMERAVFVCKRFVELAKVYGATNIIAVGTSATREARNRTEFLQKLLTETGLTVRVISGEEEARLICIAVTNGIDLDAKKALFIDLGGGSNEFAIGDQYRIFYLNSLKLGAIRLTTQFIGEGWTGTVSSSVYKKIKKHVSSQVRAVKAKVQEYNATVAWGTSGTIINLAEIANKMFKKADTGKSLKLIRKNLIKLSPILCSLTLEERRKISGMNPERADIIVAGAAIIETIMEEFDLAEINVSHKDLCDGLLVDYLSNFEGFRELQKIPVRNRSVLYLGRSCNFDEMHSETVTSLALQLFDSAKLIGLHDLGQGTRELLRHASTLHDVGDFLSFTDHNLHSCYIINNAELIGFNGNEKTIISNVARFHRKKFPTKKALKSTCLDEKSKFAVVILSTFLRFAEKLDRSHCGLVTKVEFCTTGKDMVLLSFYSDSDCSLEEWSVFQNKQAFYNAFGKKLDIQCIVSSQQ
jgi:exopolyphosphatase/guanosine-5'-triphosphate,3'-diphosphate pyrophosphatase